MIKQLLPVNLVNPLILGNIKAAYGIYGWLKIVAFTDKAQSIFMYQPWFLKKYDQCYPIQLEIWKPYKNNFIIKLKGINNRDVAMKLKNNKIIIESSQLPILNKGEYYWKDLLGCKVSTIQDYNLGKVVDLLATGSNDVMVVEAAKNDIYGVNHRLIPFIEKQVIININFFNRCIKVIWDPSYL
ncbi:MAG: ribosome maturation factor RimM [Candidatus Dasytiphilus stammeri]